MTLIKSISGIRGTIGGKPDDGLTPVDIVKYVSAFVRLIRLQEPGKKISIVVGRDARISGEMVNQLVCGTLMSMGANVFDIGLSTTPTVEITVTGKQADGGIILTASHNPAQWNALKLLNFRGEFISAADGEWLLDEAKRAEIEFSPIDEIGSYTKGEGWIEKHIRMILDLPLVDTKAIAAANFSVVIDAVNSTGGIAIPQLLEKLGVKTVYPLYCTPNGHFPHNPEPLPEHLTELSGTVVKHKADLGFVVDPDVDRLAIVDENGDMFGEEYTLVAVADYILQHTPGNTVSNLSSTRSLADVTLGFNKEYFASAVGEVNVVKMMKDVNAVIGGEGNGGIIYPELHYGRDSLVGIALFLTHLAKSNVTCSALRNKYPGYVMSKNKVDLKPGTDVDGILQKVTEIYANERVTTIDGVKIDFPDGWVHLRRSNTEPIIRVYSEGKDAKTAENFAKAVLVTIKDLTS
ncbi:MAG: phosphoglucosamine mutase [Bacteroidales bacterium]|nr:phosphoglucosamine mutase [Bacteroidales bacterium]